MSKDDLCAMADAVKSSGSDAFIVSDEIYRELYYTPESSSAQQIRIALDRLNVLPTLLPRRES